MTEPVTTNIALIVAGTGDLVNTWSSDALNPDFVAIDGFVGGVATVSVSNANVTLTVPSGFTATPSAGPTQAQNAILRFTGALTANVQITLPMPGYMIIENLTTGAFVLSFRAIGSGEVIGMPQGSVKHIYNDGTNVRFVNLPDPGSYWDLAASSIPTWLAACTKPPWLNCDGSTFNATTYPYLNALLGGNVLPDSRGRSRFALGQGTGRLTSGGAGIDGSTLLAAGGNNGVSLAAGNLPSITSSGPNAISVNAGSNNIVFAGGIPLANGTYNTYGVLAGASIGGLNSTGNNNIVVTSLGTNNAIVQNAAPGFVGGLTLIRAA